MSASSPPPTRIWRIAGEHDGYRKIITTPEGGTLFLDEVGNLALETQQMLLRAIQERRYRPIGDKTDKSFNVRIIAATNEDLENCGRA